jgi:hypothetical protein
MTREIQNQPNRPQPADKAPGGDAQGDQASGDKLQGEGNYEASRRYREGVTEFLAHADVVMTLPTSLPCTQAGTTPDPN